MIIFQADFGQDRREKSFFSGKLESSNKQLYQIGPIGNHPAADLASWSRGSWRAAFTLSSLPTAMWWSADQHKQKKNRKAAQPRIWPVLGPFWVQVGVRVRARVRGRVGLRPHHEPTKKCFLPRKREQPTAPKVRATKTLSKLPSRQSMAGILGNFKRFAFHCHRSKTYIYDNGSR